MVFGQLHAGLAATIWVHSLKGHGVTRVWS